MNPNDPDPKDPLFDPSVETEPDDLFHEERFPVPDDLVDQMVIMKGHGFITGQLIGDEGLELVPIISFFGNKNPEDDEGDYFYFAFTLRALIEFYRDLGIHIKEIASPANWQQKSQKRRDDGPQ